MVSKQTMSRRGDIVPVHDSNHPYRDCFYGWAVIIGMSTVALAIIGAGTGGLIAYSRSLYLPSTTTIQLACKCSNIECSYNYRLYIHYIGTTTTTFIPSDTLFSNVVLQQNQYLISKNYKYCAIMKSDGSLVVYTYNSGPVTAIWSSGSGGRPSSQGPFSAMLSYGMLAIYRAHSIIIWDTDTFNKGYEPHRLVMQNDGSLVIYDGTDKVQWSSK